MAKVVVPPLPPVEPGREWRSGAPRAVGMTDTGRVRDTNQDTLLIAPRVGLYLVADGMGGEAGGEVASRMAASSMVASLEALPPPRSSSEAEEALAGAVRKASRDIFGHAQAHPELRGMGTTVCALWLPGIAHPRFTGLEGLCLVAHAGDSRVYGMRALELVQVTEDHSLVQQRVKAGEAEPGDPLLQRIRNVITRAVGYQSEEEADTCFVAPLALGDRFLLCSDGLTNKVEHGEIARILAGGDLEQVVSQLVLAANHAGGEDNITALVLEF